MRKMQLLLVCTIVSFTAFANVDTVFIFSKAMQKEIKTVVIKP